MQRWSFEVEPWHTALFCTGLVLNWIGNIIQPALKAPLSWTLSSETLVRADSTSPLASKDMFITARLNASSKRNKAFPGERWYFKYSTGELDYCRVKVNKNCVTNITFTLINVLMSFESVLSVRHLQSFLTRKKNNFKKKKSLGLIW